MFKVSVILQNSCRTKCIITNCSYYFVTVRATTVLPTAGYGFVDFDSPAAALKAVHALKTSGIQAQMAKVSLVQAFVCVYAYLSCLWTSLWGCASVICACVRCVLGNDIRLVTWPQLTSCSSRDPIYFHCRNQMPRLSLPNNLPVSVIHRTTISHTNTPSCLGYTL